MPAEEVRKGEGFFPLPQVGSHTASYAQELLGEGAVSLLQSAHRSARSPSLSCPPDEQEVLLCCCGWLPG